MREESFTIVIIIFVLMMFLVFIGLVAVASQVRDLKPRNCKVELY